MYQNNLYMSSHNFKKKNKAQRIPNVKVVIKSFLYIPTTTVFAQYRLKIKKVFSTVLILYTWRLS